MTRAGTPMLSLVSTPALSGALDGELLPDFGKQCASSVEAKYLTTTALRECVEGGEVPDLIIGMDAAIRELVVLGHLDARTKFPLARCGIGVAVSESLRSPPLRNVAELVDLLLAASSLAYSRSGASGIYVARLLDELGIADRVNSRAMILDGGLAAEAVIDGRADVAIQLTPELMMVEGAWILGALPSEVQQDFRVSMVVNGPASVELDALSGLLVSASADTVYRRRGFSPLPHVELAVEIDAAEGQ